MGAQSIGTKENQICLLLVLLAAGLLPVLLWAMGHIPPDDALRHVGAAVSGKDWSEVLLLREGFDGEVSTHPLWDGALRALANVGVEADLLILLSMAFPWCLLLGSLAFMTRKPEAVLLGFLLLYMAGDGLSARFLIGRPFIIAAACTVWLLWLAQEKAVGVRTRTLFLWTAGVLTVQFLFHPSYYLALLPLGCIVIWLAWKREWQSALAMGGAYPMAVILAALLSGSPVAFLSNNFLQLYWAIVASDLPRGATGEFGEWWPTQAVGIVLLVRFAVLMVVQRANTYGPEILLTLFGVLLGFFNVRFWSDWAMVGLLFWLVRDFHQITEKYAQDYNGWRRIVSVSAIVLAFLVAGGVFNHRQLKQADTPNVVGTAVAMAEIPSWLPGDGGVVYSPDMRVFYTFFYCYAEQNWRYSTGFERALMVDENRAVVASWLNGDRREGLLPWIRALRPADRLIFHGRPNALLTGVGEPYEKLEWRAFANQFWVARLKGAGHE